MLVYTGENVVVREKDIIAILDKETYFPAIEHQKSLQLESVNLTNVKSVIVTTDNVYYSPFASQTLKKRLYTFMRT